MHLRILYFQKCVYVREGSVLLDFDVFLTVHHSIDLFHLPNLMHNFFIH